MNNKGNRYSEEFKREVMECWANGTHKSELDIANEFNIPLKTLREWREKEQPQNWYDYRDSLLQKKEALSQNKLLDIWESSINTYCQLSNNTEKLLKQYIEEITDEQDNKSKEYKINRLTEIITLAIKSQQLKANALGVGIGKQVAKSNDSYISVEEHNRIISNFVEILLKVLANNIKEQTTLDKILTQVSSYQNTINTNSLRRIK